MKKMYQITDEGKKELEAELAELVGRRGAIADKISEARDFGDLSENAEYDSAREEQGLVESRVAEIEDILVNAELIKAVKSSKVILGSKVELQLGKKKTAYSVVGPVEADPLEGKISNESPLGEALMGKKVGDTATISTQKGEITYEIIAIN
ncbi:MAG TPA: transcription elongation factor GreA [Candidatus Saccharimonadales bacterium]|jgi:transcription elongation factor GreA|nr:transcription elongation factor GreA [Candidatus Saccharimonadales bacterium]